MPRRGYNRGFVDLLSQAFMAFVSQFEEKHKQITGKYSPEYLEYLQDQVGNVPPQVAAQQEQQISAIKNWANSLSQPGAGKRMQQAHAFNRQMQM